MVSATCTKGFKTSQDGLLPNDNCHNVDNNEDRDDNDYVNDEDSDNNDIVDKEDGNDNDNVVHLPSSLAKMSQCQVAQKPWLSLSSFSLS